MKIIVNNKAAINRKKKLVEKILIKATKYAKEGYDTFEYFFEDDERMGLIPPTIQISVQEESEATVLSMVNGDYGTHMKFKIVLTNQ